MASPESTPPPPWVPLETKDCSQGLCSPFCPQWCYILFPPPPPPPFSFDPENVDSSSTAPTFSPLVIAVIGILSCAFLLVGYYTVVSKFCGGASFIRGCRSRRGTAPPGGSESDDEDPGMQARRRRHDQEWQHLPPAVGLDDALISKITVCRYKRGDGPVGGCTDCSVCLGEFREDESLRLLPKCGHAFHVRCIDAWLKSHSNCPLCRASVVVLASPAPPQLPAPARPVSSETIDETVVVVVGESTEEGEGTGSENGGEDAMEEAVDDDETMVGGSSSRRSDEEGEHSKQGSGSSTGRFCLTRQGRAKNSVLPV